MVGSRLPTAQSSDANDTPSPTSLPSHLPRSWRYPLLDAAAEASAACEDHLRFRLARTATSSSRIKRPERWDRRQTSFPLLGHSERARSLSPSGSIPPSLQSAARFDGTRDRARESRQSSGPATQRLPGQHTGASGRSCPRPEPIARSPSFPRLPTPQPRPPTPSLSSPVDLSEFHDDWPRRLADLR